jgi:sulfur carrier protein
MELIINGEKVELEVKTLNITELLISQKVESPDMVSVQINNEFINKEIYSTRSVKDNDQVDFLYFMGGGQ